MSPSTSLATKTDLLSLVISLTEGLAGIWTASIQWDCASAPSATIRVDRDDWETDALIIATTAERLIGQSEYIEVGNGFITIFTESGVVRCRTAGIRHTLAPRTTVNGAAIWLPSSAA